MVRQRYARGLSKVEAAELAGVSDPTIHNIETGKVKRVSAKVLYKLATAFGEDPLKLYDMMESDKDDDAGDAVC